MCTLHVPFFVFAHMWVAPIYVVNVVADVLVCVDVNVGLLPHIPAWRYQLLVFGNTTSV